MKRIYSIALLAALAAAPVTLEAQNPRVPRTQEQAERRHDGASPQKLLQLRNELGLTAEQVSQLEGIRQRLQQQNTPLIEQLRASGAWQERRAQGEARTGEQGRIAPEQREQARQRMENMTPEQREPMRQRMQNMTPEQREAMRRQMQERRQGAEAGRRTERQMPEELRPVMQQMQANTRSALQEARAVLTAEQQTRLSELVQQRRGPATGREGQRRGARTTR